MAGFNRRDFLKRSGAGAASSVLPGGGGVGKALAGLDPVKAAGAVGSAMNKIRVDTGIFADGVKMIQDGVYKFKNGWLDTLGTKDLYKYIIGDRDAKEIANVSDLMRELKRNGSRWEGGQYAWDDPKKKAEYDRLDRSLENRLAKVTITDEQIGEILARSEDGAASIGSVDGAVHWMKKNGANDKSLLKVMRSYVQYYGGAKKVMDSIRKYVEFDEANIDDILEIPGVRDVLPELDEVFIKDYKDARRRYEDEEDEAFEADTDPYGRDQELDWYVKSDDPYLKTKERFHESKNRKIHCFTESYRYLVKTTIDIK